MPKKKQRSKTRKKSQSSHGEDLSVIPKPGIADLRMLLDCYREIENGKARTVSQAASNLKLKADAIYRSIEKFRKHTSKELFRLSRGHEAKIEPEATPIFQQIGELIQTYESLFGGREHRLRIRIGAGVTFCSCVLPNVIRLFREEDPDVDVEIVYGLPSDLHSAEEKGSLDLLVVTCPEDMRANFGTNTTCVDLELALIGPHAHQTMRLAKKKNEFSWEMLAGQTVGLLSERYPNPPYPAALFNRSDVRILRFRSFLILHSMVTAGDLVTFSLPQLLTESQRSHVDVLSYKNARSISLALVRSTKMKIPRTHEDRQRITRLHDLIVGELERLSKGTASGELTSLPRERTAFHAISTPIGHCWAVGEVFLTYFANLALTGDYVLKGFLSPQVEAKIGKELKNRRYELTGNIETHNDKYHIASQGRRIDNSRDVFSAHYFANSFEELKSKPLVGTWIGRRTSETGADEFQPAIGSTVLMLAGDAEKIENANQLNSIIKDFHQRGRTKLQLELPSC